MKLTWSPRQKWVWVHDRGPYIPSAGHNCTARGGLQNLRYEYNKIIVELVERVKFIESLLETDGPEQAQAAAEQSYTAVQHATDCRCDGHEEIIRVGSGVSPKTFLQKVFS